MKQDTLELRAAYLVSGMVRRLPRYASLLFASPLCCRTPDTNLLWHPNYRNQHPVALLLGLLAQLARNTATGLVRFVLPAQYGFTTYGQPDGCLYVAATDCGQWHKDTYQTPYLPTQPSDYILVYGPYQALPRLRRQRFVTVGRWQQLQALVALAWQGRVLVARSVQLFLLYMGWVVGLQWVPLWQLENELNVQTVVHNIEKLGCAHEMHAYSRVVWRVAQRFGLEGYAVQHATVTTGKRWYFSYAVERFAGLPYPQTLYVFDPHAANLLRDVMPLTQFKLGCSGRYTHWKQPQTIRRVSHQHGLFVTALALWDVQLILDAISGLNTTTAVRLRIHPKAVLPFAMRKQLYSLIRDGRVVWSTAPLRDDLVNAAYVVGASTTVLEEALLFNKPILQLRSPYQRYLELGEPEVAGTRFVHPRDLAQHIADLPQPGTLMYLEGYTRLGLSQPTVTYATLFV